MSQDNQTTQWHKELAERANGAAAVFSDLVKTIAALRHPETGCPWDLKQTHKSLRKFMIEEAYEAAEVMDSDDYEGLVGELGDVLLQVVLNAQLLTDAGRSDIIKVIETLTEKMKRRHPHVFTDKDRNLSQEALHRQWNAIKAKEKAKSKTQNGQSAIFAEAEKLRFPAGTQAAKIGKIARSIGFDWANPLEVIEQVQSELDELKSELAAKKPNEENVELELGDLYFSLAQLSRHLGHDPEVVASLGNQKFLKRFAKVEEIAENRDLDIEKLSQKELEALWVKAKLAEVKS